MIAWLLIYGIIGMSSGFTFVPGISTEEECHRLANAVFNVDYERPLTIRHRCISYHTMVPIQ